MLVRVNSVNKRQCIGGKCFMLDAEEERRKNWQRGGIIIGINIIKIGVLGSEHSVRGDENRLKMFSLLAIMM